MSQAKKIADGRIRIPVRFNYAHLFQPDPFYKDKVKYTAVLIIDKNDKETVDLVKNTIKEAHASATAGTMKFTLTKDNQPLKDGAEEFPDNPAFENAYCMKATTTRQPMVLRKEKDGTFIQLKDGGLKDGDYGLIIVSIRPYAAQGNNGIAAYIDRVLFTREGPALGGLSNEDAFGDADPTEASDEDIF